MTTSRAQRIKCLVESLLRESSYPQSITASDLHIFEDQLNQRIWNPVGVYLILNGPHFKDRLSRPEHYNEPITMTELTRIFVNFSRFHMTPLLSNVPLKAVYEGVIREKASRINIGFILKPYDYRGFNRVFVAKMILRKSNFKTPDKFFDV